MHQNNENNHEMDGEDRCNNDKTNASIHQKMKNDNNNNKIFGTKKCHFSRSKTQSDKSNTHWTLKMIWK